MNKRTSFFIVSLAVGLVSGTALAAGPAARSAIDLGSAHAFEGDSPMTVVVALKLRNPGELEGLIQSTYASGSPNYRQFLTPDQFSTRFGPTSDSVGRVTRHLQAAGFAVERTATTQLTVTGRMSAIEREFGVSLHTFEVPAAADARTYRFRAPAGAAQLAGEIAGDVEAVVGLNNRPHVRPMIRRAPSTSRGSVLRPATAAPNTPDPPGVWTVTDLAQYYDVTPLYQHGLTGKNRTIGIVTFAAFTPSDVFAYWASLGLKVDPHRLTIVNVDGGPGAPSDASGSDETTLDVEQSGGLAPGAKMIVYQAPNTDQGFLDVFAQAIGSNRADAISTSWGEWEEFLVQGTAVSDPDAAGTIRATHNLFIQAAIQGQSLSAASGDSGSYDAAEVFPPPDFSNVLAVDHPAADPFVLAAGGTTLPGKQVFTLNDGSTFTVNIPQERAWSWDYLNGLCASLGFDPISCGIFPAGGGGGVSVVFPVPFYQLGLAGINTSEPQQVLTDLTQTPPQKLIRLPARFPGRNLPDISLNADPDTGYTIYYTSDVDGFGVLTFIGGTSFVAPQLAGITALLDQNAGGRVGLLNFALYALAEHGNAYAGGRAPLRDIRKGNNEFYNAGAGYDQATGLGVLDVANLADALR